MSVATLPARAASPTRSHDWELPGPLWLWAVTATVLSMSIARTISDANDLTSPGTFGVAIRTAAPIAMAGLAGLYAERSGTVNIGLEGMMIMGTVFAGWFGWLHGPWAALLGGVIGGLLAGLLLGVATVTFGVNHIVAGFAINILAPGVARYMANVLFQGTDGGSLSNSPTVAGTMGEFSMPFTSGGHFFGWTTWDPLGRIASWHWFAVSDVAGFLSGVTTDVRYDVLVAVVLFVMTAYVLWRTPFGLRLRSAGERPSAADSLGVNVYFYRYVGVSISGMLAGLGGAMLVIGSGRYAQGQTVGKGYLGLATLVVGNWRPLGVGAAASMFGYFDGITKRLSPDKLVLALLVAATLLLLAGIAYLFATKRYGIIKVLSVAAAGAAVLIVCFGFAEHRHDAGLVFTLWLTVGFAACAIAVVVATRVGALAAAMMAMAAVAAAFAYLRLDEIPDEFVDMLPYIVTLVVVSSRGKALRPPAEEGEPWFKGSQ